LRARQTKIDDPDLDLSNVSSDAPPQLPDLRFCSIRYNGIYFRLVSDASQHYGNDETAMKAASHERRTQLRIQRIGRDLWLPNGESYVCTSGM